MSYQRMDKPGRFYVWMGDDLHICTGYHSDTGQPQEITLSHNPEGVDNALAIMQGCRDLLTGAGFKIELSIKKRGREKS